MRSPLHHLVSLALVSRAHQGKTDQTIHVPDLPWNESLQQTRHRTPLPVLVPALVMVMGLASAAALVMFLGHILRSLRVDSMMVAVHQEAAATVARAYPDDDEHSKDPDPDPGLIDSDAEAIRKFARRVDLALAGDLDNAFRDRAGETRSV